jgi:tetraacyldisaccharide 4'-kinase
VGANRYQAGLLAERQIPLRPGRVHLLDDGFQHRQLARAVDIVALHASDLHSRLLPVGRLREPLKALRRADVIVLREEDAPLAAELPPFLRQGTPVWLVRRKLSLPISETSLIAFCGIARPQEFFTGLEAAGARLSARVSFRDHHNFDLRDIEHLLRLHARNQGSAFVTTEKDAVRLSPGLRARLTETAPLHCAGLSLEILDERAALDWLVERIGVAAG